MGHLHETPLAAVMEFPPLRQAFGGYCQKALCSEVRWSTVNSKGVANPCRAVHLDRQDKRQGHFKRQSDAADTLLRYLCMVPNLPRS